MIDRISQLKNMLPNQSETEYKQDNMQENSVLTQKIQEGIGQQFFGQIALIKEMILSLRNNSDRIQNLKGKYAKAIKPAHEKANSQQMNEIINGNSEIFKRLKEKLDKTRQKVEQAELKEPNEPETRMKKNFYMSLTQQVKSVIQKQQTYEEEFRITVKDKIARQVRFIDREITEQQVQQYVNDPNMAQEMLQKKMYGNANNTLLNTVSDIQDKFKDILTLQVSVKKCLKLFEQLSALVAAQGQMIDNIQANVVQTKDYVQKALVKLEKAKQNNETSKKFYCKLIGVCLIVIGVIIGIIVLTS